MKNNTPYLCGGIFFDLLLQARKNRVKARDKQQGGTDGLSDQDVMKGLIRVVTGNDTEIKGSTFAKATSQYKTCEISGNTYIPFKDTATITAFDTAFKFDIFSMSNRMFEFIDKFLNPKKREWLVKALIETIKYDNTISDNVSFSVLNRDSIAKKEFDDIVCVNLSIFLVSVLHFILTTRPDNDKGRSTFEEWFYRDNTHAEWKFNSKIGSKITQRIEFALDDTALTAYAEQRMNGQTQNTEMNKYTHTRQVISLAANIMGNKEEPFEKYLERTKDFYSKVKTLLYSEKPRLIYDFYVCNVLQMYPKPKIGAHIWDDTERLIYDASIPKIEPFTNYVIIKGTGGIGKSMMMRHLLLDSIENFKFTQKLPILIQLKNYSSDCDLQTFSYQTVKAADNTILPNQVYDLLETGNCILLLDGLDEIPNSVRGKFESDLEYMTIRYPDNMYVISSRPTSKFLSYNRFTVMDIKEFSKDQSLELIDKLDFHDKEVKDKFREDLDKHLFKSHQQFASNPLLLTIMLMTYSSIGDIPRKMHIFYRKAFETMARLHDATKGSYKRPLHTKMEPEEFAEYFAEFCARAYKDEVLEFSLISFCDYMDRVIKHKKKKLDCVARDFLLDLKDNLCVMYEEGDKYYFVHRSFQEYFTADFYSKQMDDKLPEIAEQFIKLRQKSYHDKTFDMLYDMIPQKIDRFVFVPYLKELWNKCDEKDGYWTFLSLIYPTIYSFTGDCEEWDENTPEDFFYDFIVNENEIRYNGQLDDLDWPEDASWFQTHYATILSEEQTLSGTKLVSKAINVESFEFGDYAKTQGEGYEPDWCGMSWEIDIDEIFDNRERYKNLVSFMENDDFPLKKEYNLMRTYSKKLFAQFDKKINEIDSDDWFDNL